MPDIHRERIVERRKCVDRVNLFPFSPLPRYDYTIRVPANVATIVGLVYA